MAKSQFKGNAVRQRPSGNPESNHRLYCHVKACAYESQRLDLLKKHQLKHGGRRMHPYGTVKNPRAVRNVAAERDDRESESDEPDDTMAGVDLIQTADLSAAQESSGNSKDQLIQHLVQEVKRLNSGMQQLATQVSDMGAKMENARRNADRRHTVLQDNLQERVNITEQQLQAMHERMEGFEADNHRTAKELHRMNLVTSEQHWRLDDLWTDYKMPKQYRDNVADPMPQLEVVMVDKGVDATDGDRLPERSPRIMDFSRRAFGKEAILERVAEGPPPLVPAPKVCRYLDKRFAKFQVPADRNELLKYIEGMKGMTRGQSCWDPEAKLFDDRYLIVNICAELEPQDWAHMTRYFRVRAAHVFRQLASEHGLQIRRQPELEFREPIHRGFYTYIAYELNRISAKMGSEERFTVEKARRRVYEEANNCSSQIEMGCRLYQPRVSAGYRCTQTHECLLRGMANIKDSWSPPLSAIYAASSLIDRQIVVFKYRLDQPEHDTGGDMGIEGYLTSPLLLCREFTGQWSRLWPVRDLMKVGDLPSTDKRYETEGEEQEPGECMVSFDEPPDITPRGF